MTILLSCAILSTCTTTPSPSSLTTDGSSMASAFSLLPTSAHDLFKCPEKFGYFPDASDCSKYFVCVFGEALHEACTGGLFFSAELQTCDWPRNVPCSIPAQVDSAMSADRSKGSDSGSVSVYDEVDESSDARSEKGSSESQDEEMDRRRGRSKNPQAGNNSPDSPTRSSDDEEDYDLDVRREKYNKERAKDHPRNDNGHESNRTAGNHHDSRPGVRLTQADDASSSVNWRNGSTTYGAYNNFPHSLPPLDAPASHFQPTLMMRHSDRQMGHQRHNTNHSSERLQNQERGDGRVPSLRIPVSMSTPPHVGHNAWHMSSAFPFMPTPTPVDPFSDSYSATPKPKVNGLHHNKLLMDNENDPQPPTYESEAIPPVVDSKGGIHFSDGAGGTFGLSDQLPGLLSHSSPEDKSAILLVKRPGARLPPISSKDKERIDALTNVFREHFNPSRLPTLNPLIPPPRHSYRPPTSRQRTRTNANQDQYIPVIQPIVTNPRKSGPVMEKDPFRYHQVVGPMAPAPVSFFTDSRHPRLPPPEPVEDNPVAKESITNVDSQKLRYLEREMDREIEHLKSQASFSMQPPIPYVPPGKRSIRPIFFNDSFTSDRLKDFDPNSGTVLMVPVRVGSGARPGLGRVRVVPSRFMKVPPNHNSFVENSPDFGVVFDDEPFDPSSVVRNRHLKKTPFTTTTPATTTTATTTTSTTTPSSPKERDFGDDETMKYSVEGGSLAEDEEIVEDYDSFRSPYTRLARPGTGDKPETTTTTTEWPSVSSGATRRPESTTASMEEKDFRDYSAFFFDHREKNHPNHRLESHAPRITPHNQTHTRNSYRNHGIHDETDIIYGAKPRVRDHQKETRDRSSIPHSPPSSTFTSYSKPHKNTSLFPPFFSATPTPAPNPTTTASSTSTTATTTTTTSVYRTTTTTPKPTTVRTIRTTSLTPKPKHTTMSVIRLLSHKKSRPTNKRLIVKHRTTVAPKLPSRPKAVHPTPPPLTPASKCDVNKCRLPDCNCGGTAIPGNLKAEQVPQIVTITFDDAINDLNWEIYEEIFNNGRKNPNGCSPLGTFYVSHEWTDYGQVQTLYSRGHEIASHGITHSFGEKFSKNQWLKEMQGQREILHLVSLG